MDFSSGKSLFFNNGRSGAGPPKRGKTINWKLEANMQVIGETASFQLKLHEKSSYVLPEAKNRIEG